MSKRNPTPEEWAANSLPYEKALSTIELDYGFLYQHFFAQLFRTALHIVEIRGAPESINYDFMMMCIILLGRAAYFKPEQDLVALNAAPAGKPDLYYIPDRILVTNPRFNRSYNLQPGVDCEIVYCTSMDPYYWGRGSGGMYSLISTTASLLADNYLSLNVAQKNLRLTTGFACDDQNTYLSLEAAMQEAYDGKPFFIVQKSLVDQLEKLPVYADSSNQSLIQLLDVHKYILSEYYAAIGLSESQQMKKERLITAEVEDGAELPLFNIQDMIDSITAGIDRVNLMFETEMQVVVNPLILRNLYGDQSEEQDAAAPELEEEPAEDEPETSADDQSEEPTEPAEEEPAEEPAPEDAAEVVADAAELIEDAAEIIEQAADLIGGGDEDAGSEDPIPESP
jgi:hypothetical protein